jgi:DNA-binding MarR family transcriptional regulator
MTSLASPLTAVGGGSLLHRVGRELVNATDQRLREFGLTSQQASLLANLAAGARTPTDLVDVLGSDTAAVTRLVDRVEAAGLVRRERHPSDRRSVTVDLTDEGRALLPRIAPVFTGVTERLFDGFTDAEVTDLTALLHRMLANMVRPNAA